MIPRLTPTLGICIAGALVTGGLLFLPADDEPTGTDAYGQPLASAVEVPDPDITIEDFAFGDPVTVSAGATVTVLNADGVHHTLTATDGAFDTGALARDTTGVFEVPAEPGTYAFFCSIHPFMSGDLTVE